MSTAQAGDGRFGTVVVSDCLLGKRVRWDGDHNGDVWPRRAALSLFNVVGLCPEVGIGLGVPRPPIRLTGPGTNPHAVAVADPRQDFTNALRSFAHKNAAVLNAAHGCIFADRSPSCGVMGVKVFTSTGAFARTGRGVFAAAVLQAHPHLPAVDAETLNEPKVLRAFALAVARCAKHPDDKQLRQRVDAAIAHATATPERPPGSAASRGDSG